MKKQAILLSVLGLFAFFMHGCVTYNLQPLYQMNDLTADPDLSGVWTEEGENYGNETLTFVKNADKTYGITDYSKSKNSKEKYIGGLIKLNGQLFLDAISGEDTPASEKLLLKVRVILRVVFNGKKFKMEPLDDSWLKEQFLKDKLKVGHVINGDDVILMASTSDLQKFIFKIANNAQAFSSGGEYAVKMK